jgi:hypothetical protein
MRFIETPVFTTAVDALLSPDALHAMQLALVLRPTAGSVIRKSGGLRKMRWAVPGKGKRGGLRVIYFWDESSETFYLLYVYRKSDQDDLSAKQIKALAQMVREEFQ